MSRKPQTTATHHDASAPNCVHHGNATDPARPERICVKCKRDARNATRRRAHRP